MSALGRWRSSCMSLIYTRVGDALRNMSSNELLSTVGERQESGYNEMTYISFVNGDFARAPAGARVSEHECRYQLGSSF